MMAKRTDSILGWGVAAILLVSLSVACADKKPPVARPIQPPDTSEVGAAPMSPSGPVTPVREAPLTPTPALTEDALAGRSVDDLNRDSPFKPVFFGYDSAELTPEARAILDENSTTLKTYTSWVITVEGHCDERGTAEYNLALGERRAVSAQSYLVSLGIPASRIRIVSYGKEFPFDPGHDEGAWGRNRRAHIVITGK
jgi:peptidoglycan-associated lipoprotein